MDLQKWLNEALEKMENMSPEEIQHSIYGYTQEEFEKYEKEDFVSDFLKVKQYFETNDHYSFEHAAYHPEDKIDFIDEKMFIRVFNNKGNKIGIDDMHESTTVYEGIRKNTFHGQGSCTNLSKYTPKDGDIHHKVLDYDTNHVKYVAGEGTDAELSVSTDDLSTHVSIRHHNGLFSMSKEEFKTFRDILNMVKLDVDKDGW